MQTRLMTIMFIDVQGFTKRTANQTLEETKVFIEETRSFVTEHLEKWNGKLIKTIGDGFLGSFDAPTTAIQAALEIQRKLESRNANILNPENFVRFRIGINTGEIAVDEHGDVFGDPVNIAARIESFCEPNEVFISEATYLAINRNQFSIKDLGPQMFKNATREIRIYKILRHGPELGGASTATAPAASAAAGPAGTPGNAVKTALSTFWGPTGWGKWVIGVLVFFLVVVPLFKKLGRALSRKFGSDGGPASGTVALPPLVPLPGLKGGKVPLLVPALHPEVSLPVPGTKEAASAPSGTAAGNEDDDLGADDDLTASEPDVGEEGKAGQGKTKHGFWKMFQDGVNDRKYVNKLVKQGKPDEAARYVELRMKEASSQGTRLPANAFIGLAQLYKQSKQYDKAIETLERGVKANPFNPGLKKILDEARKSLARLNGGK